MPGALKICIGAAIPNWELVASSVYLSYGFTWTDASAGHHKHASHLLLDCLNWMKRVQYDLFRSSGHRPAMKRVTP